jgi:hypothetical protein
MAERNDTGATRNEGEGNRTAARRYNREQEQFVKSGRVEERARDAAEAIEGPERDELEAAEAIGKDHIAEEDPAIRDRIHQRAYELWEAEGRPDDRHIEHWLQAEREAVPTSTATSAETEPAVIAGILSGEGNEETKK